MVLIARSKEIANACKRRCNEEGERYRSRLMIAVSHIDSRGYPEANDK